MNNIYSKHYHTLFPTMNPILFIAFLLFASLFFLPTSTMARQLNGGTISRGNPNQPLTCRNQGSYRNCLPLKLPPPPSSQSCSSYKRSCRTPPS
ncbi:uncharacterized protein HKW66_Vig0044190 [Vigna angularis]|uniref:Uncharacterized protein n=2 Tax=Phaseolus angularis TaxID=3914 RepID=A0A8T0KZQ2_PHAAN|nr:uncharacterized protein HKW66_Vig0044190 [Vigna angularis]BAT84719.1 hypothetical protein VIGAN_04216000 [Vigna angularis var. angularis]